MWGAIKSDLLSFVTTITDDTTKTITRVLGEEEPEEEDVSIQEKIIADLRRSFETYDTPIREGDQRDYERFKKKFNLSSSAADIAYVLDEEPEVSRFYAELVPIKLTPEDFWSRLFFRVHQINRNGGVALDEDDEEELVWDEEEAFTPDHGANSTASVAPSGAVSTLSSQESQSEKAGTTKSSQTIVSPTADAGSNAINPTSQSATQTISHAGGQVDITELISVNQHMNERVVELEQENLKLQSHEEALNRRIQELEALLAAQSFNSHLPAEPPTPTSQLSSASSATTPQSSRAQETDAVPTTTPPSHAYHNTSTPPTAAATSARKKNSASTAKKLFDSPAGADAPVRAGLVTTSAVTATASPASAAVRKLPGSPLSTSPVTVPVSSTAAPENASQSSEDSAVVVSRSDANSLADDDLPPVPAKPSASTSSASAPVRAPATTVPGVVVASTSAGASASPAGPGKTGFSGETAKYLAALDDQDEEEDGWN